LSPTKDISELLKNMAPEPAEGKYYVATVDESQLMTLAGYLDYLVDIFQEDEGLSIVFLEEIKEEISSLTEQPVVGPFAKITLTVHSDLLAVGFLARITEALAMKEIPVNAFSAYYHDHLFVPYEKKDEAMAVLRKLTE
jgi:hypothetical protein